MIHGLQQFYFHTTNKIESARPDLEEDILFHYGCHVGLAVQFCHIHWSFAIQVAHGAWSPMLHQQLHTLLLAIPVCPISRDLCSGQHHGSVSLLTPLHYQWIWTKVDRNAVWDNWDSMLHHGLLKTEIVANHLKSSLRARGSYIINILGHNT